MFFLETDRLILVSTPLAVVRTRLKTDSFSAPVPLPESSLTVTFPSAWPGDGLVFFPGIDEAGVEPGDWGGTLIEKSSSTAIGQLGCLGQPDEAGVIEIGYGLNPSARGQGYATEIVGALTDWLLARPDVSLVRADTAVENAASQRVLEKNGFASIGIGHSEDDGALLLWEKR
jgi:[ribosomal protein S5]-alanine N-acetyltransferase